MEALGTHLLLDMEGCDAALLDDLDYVRQTALSAANDAGAAVVGETFHKFHPVGVTGIVAIAESHIGIHTWPEHGFAAADIFTCGEMLRPHRAARRIARRLGCESPSITEIARGARIRSAAAV